MINNFEYFRPYALAEVLPAFPDTHCGWRTPEAQAMEGDVIARTVFGY